MRLDAQILAKNGRKEFAVLPYEEYQALRERLADAEDLATLRRAMREDDRRQPGMSIAQLKRHLGLTRKTARRRAPSRPVRRRSRG